MGRIGVIGGSGLYNIDGVEKIEWCSLDTPWGRPSDEFLIAELEGREIVFLPRHGRDHKLSPSDINYRANIYGMKELGVDSIISISACGSLKEGIKPLDFVIPTQFVDRTFRRKSSFFEEGIVAHIAFSQPVCLELARLLYDTIDSMDNVEVHWGKSYVNIEGPQFSTLAESNLYRQWGLDVIGMTNATEAKLAREAEICYVTLAAISDYDCWNERENSVDVEIVIENLKKNIENAKSILKRFVTRVAKEDRDCCCKSALERAIITPKEKIPQHVKEKLKLIIGKYID